MVMGVCVCIFLYSYPPKSFQDQKSLIHYIRKISLSFEVQSINSTHPLKWTVRKKWHWNLISHLTSVWQGEGGVLFHIRHGQGWMTNVISSLPQKSWESRRRNKNQVPKPCGLICVLPKFLCWKSNSLVPHNVTVLKDTVIKLKCSLWGRP